MGWRAEQASGQLSTTLLQARGADKQAKMAARLDNALDIPAFGADQTPDCQELPGRHQLVVSGGQKEERVAKLIEGRIGRPRATKRPSARRFSLNSHSTV